ncbi:MAG: citrate lyase subunit alpha, partial [Clostridia bacterium]|nr:citrate lyase subunit alpha [Clostridia bacterium]
MALDMSGIPHIAEISAQHGPFTGVPEKASHTFFERMRYDNKIVHSLREAIEKSGLQDGMTISFHHHFRNGDYVVNMVLEEIAKMGIKNLTLAASSLTSIHAPLVGHIKNGVITHVETSGLRGDLAETVSAGLMDFPVVFRS